MDIKAFLEGVYQSTNGLDAQDLDVMIRSVSMTGHYKGMNFRLTVNNPVSSYYGPVGEVESDKKFRPFAKKADY